MWHDTSVNNSADRERRSLERVSMRSDKPVFIRSKIDKGEVDLPLENLSTAGATLIYSQPCEWLGAGKRLEECRLVLPDAAPFPVSAIVRWRMPPRIGIEFDDMPEEAKVRVTDFLRTL